MLPSTWLSTRIQPTQVSTIVHLTDRGMPIACPFVVKRRSNTSPKRSDETPEIGSHAPVDGSAGRRVHPLRQSKTSDDPRDQQKTRAVRRPEHQCRPTWNRPRGICRCSNFFLNGRTPVSRSNVIISAPRLIDLYQTSTKSGAVLAGGIAAHANSLFLAVKSQSNERTGRLIARFAAGIDGCIPEARGAADGDDPKGTVRATSPVYRQRPARAEASCPGKWQGPLHKKWSVSRSMQTMRSSEPPEARVSVGDVDLRKVHA